VGTITTTTTRTPTRSCTETTNSKHSTSNKHNNNNNTSNNNNDEQGWTKNSKNTCSQQMDNELPGASLHRVVVIVSTKSRAQQARKKTIGTTPTPPRWQGFYANTTTTTTHRTGPTGFGASIPE